MPHRLLSRQLKKLGLRETAPPDPEAWTALLDRISATYAEADQDRYTIERSLEISSREMQKLYQDLQGVSESTAATLHATVEASPDAILVLDRDSRVVKMNRRYVEMWGVPPELADEVDSEPLLRWAASKVVHPDAFVRQVQDVRANPEASLHDVIELADGRVFERFLAPVLLPGGKAVGRVWFFRDDTLRRRAETQLLEAKDAAEKASRAKSGFLSNMSHELRTPLNSILGFARVLDSERVGPLTDRQREYLDYILRASHHMLHLINDLLDLRRLEEDRASIAVTRLAIRPIVDEAVDLVRALIDDHQHALAIEVAPELPEAVADRRAVVQILVNLLSNAVKFTPKGGRIAVAARTAEPNAIRIAVTDSGIGIAPEDQARLFTYFEQLGAKHAHSMQGSGIGLALTRALVEKMGGVIEVRSERGCGSTFEFSIPRWTEPA